MIKTDRLVRQNRTIARRFWPSQLDKTRFHTMKQLTEAYGFSIALGDLVILNADWYVTYKGLIRLALRNRCRGIHVEPAHELSNPSSAHWAFKATVYKSPTCKGFIGYGDADPSNVSPLVRGGEMRVAETRAVNRALRKAYGIGLCSVEELGARDRDGEPAARAGKRPPQSAGEKENGNGNGNGNGSGGPRVRDRLCQLIRRYGLDPESVKAYALEFCGTASLKDAPRARVEQFVAHLAEQAERDRDALLCQLNSYPRTEEKQEESKAGAA